MGSTSKEGFLRHRCPTHSGKLVNVKKDGAGGKGTWGKLLDTDSNSRIDQIDPNSDSNEVRATEFLIENSRIMLIRSNHDKHHSYVNLQTQAMFNNLVSLYSGLFLTQWQHFHHFMAQFTPPPNTQPHVHAAQVYISTWFIDLYVSNREAVKKLSYLTFNDRFFTELTPVSREYDRYLTLLNASIRPTHVKYTMDDAIYVPIIANTLNLEAERRNYFGIAGFDANESIFYGVIQIMKDRKCWNFSAISNGCTLGRPCWLLDWHADDRVCAWFRMEGNFDFVDVTLAYILGVACTPKLGARDVDEWQFFTNAVVPADVIVADCERVDPRNFYGSYEVRTVEIEYDYVLPTILAEAYESARKAKRSRTDVELAATDILAPRYRIVDWTYYCLVVLNIDVHTRTQALRMISLL